MARKTNPYTEVLKRLTKLQGKADKLNAELASFVSFIESASKQGDTPLSAKKAPKTKRARRNFPRKPVPKKSVKNPKANAPLEAAAKKTIKVPKSK
jgi:hypothetical protein